MDKDEILKIAKEKYPVGTIVNSLGGNKNEKITNTLFQERKHLVNSLEHNSDCLIYYNGQWAEIISTPSKNYELW